MASNDSGYTRVQSGKYLVLYAFNGLVFQLNEITLKWLKRKLHSFVSFAVLLFA